MTDPKYLLLGEILRPHGVRGELRMKVLTAYPERIPALSAIFLAPKPEATNKIRRFNVSSMRMHQGYALLTLENVTDRNAAELLRGLFVMVDIREAIPLEDDEIYLYQLIGMKVVTTEGETLGTISDVLETGANDVYVVKSPQYGEVLIPVIEETIISTDTETNCLTVKLPEGLLPDRG